MKFTFWWRAGKEGMNKHPEHIKHSGCSGKQGARRGAGQERWGGREEASFLTVVRKAAPRRHHVSVRPPSNLANTPEFGGIPSLRPACWPTSASKCKQLSEESLSWKGKGVPPKQINSVSYWVLLLLLKAASQESGKTPWTSPPLLPSYDRPGTHFLSELPRRTHSDPARQLGFQEPRFKGTLV